MVAPGGKVHGFDVSEQFLALARARAAAASQDVNFQAADAVALPLPDASLDAYRAERVYMHLRRPEAALAEAFRILRPGGRLLIMDQDWDTLVFDGEIMATRAVTHAFADSLINGTVARRMRSLLQQAGFDDIVVTAETTVGSDGSTGWMADTIGKAALAAGLNTPPNDGSSHPRPQQIRAVIDGLALGQDRIPMILKFPRTDAESTIRTRDDEGSVNRSVGDS